MCHINTRISADTYAHMVLIAHCVFMCRCLAQRACELLPHTDIYNIYGPTEATIWVSSWHCNGGNFEGAATSPIGGPMANTHLHVLDEELQPVPIGELIVCS